MSHDTCYGYDPTWSSVNLSATMYLTLQLLSSAHCLRVGITETQVSQVSELR